MNFGTTPLFRPLVSALMLVLLASTAVYAADDDDAKLEALKRAVSGDQAQGGKKVRTRAIVFDNEPQGNQAAAPSKQAAAPAANCQALPRDAAGSKVDFAIQFKVGSAEIAPQSEGTLRSIAKILSLAPEKCVLVEGHTDSSGNAGKNQALSQERANSVVDFFARRDLLDRSRLVSVGKGSSDPAPGLDPRDPKNRRVVFKIVSQ